MYHLLNTVENMKISRDMSQGFCMHKDANDSSDKSSKALSKYSNCSTHITNVGPKRTIYNPNHEQNN